MIMAVAAPSAERERERGRAFKELYTKALKIDDGFFFLEMEKELFQVGLWRTRL